MCPPRPRARPARARGWRAHARPRRLGEVTRWRGDSHGRAMYSGAVFPTTCTVPFRAGWGCGDDGPGGRRRRHARALRRSHRPLRSQRAARADRRDRHRARQAPVDASGGRRRLRAGREVRPRRRVRPVRKRSRIVHADETTLDYVPPWYGERLLLGDWNWYLPRGLSWLPRVGGGGVSTQRA